MATYNKILQFTKDLIDGVHQLNGVHQLRVALSNTAIVNTNSILSAVTQIAAGNGYTTGGGTSGATTSSTTTASGNAKLTCTDCVFTATGGSIASLRYAVLYNDTPTSPADPTIAWWDYGSSIAPASGETFTVDFDGTNGVFQLA